MIRCEEVRELIPWYVTGRIEIETAREIAEHLATCSECQADFAEAAWMRRLVMKTAEDAAPRAAVWSRIERRAGLVDLARIDVGSLLIGLKLGISASSKRYPVRGSLRVLGHNVRIVGRRSGKEAGRV
jgi:anti-sigma factor RsiW